MAMVLRNVTAEVVDLEFEKIPSVNPHRLMVRGQISKQIIYGADKGIVNYQDAIDHFEVMVDLDESISNSELQIRAEVEHISPKLLDDGVQVDQQIILKVYLEPGDFGSALTKNFLIRSIDYLNDPKVAENVDEVDPATDKVKREFQKIKVKAKHPAPEPKIIPIPDVTLIINEKIEELEELLHDELADSLRVKLHNELEHSLRHQIEEEVLQSVHHRLRNELEESIYQRLRQEFKAQLEDQLAQERQVIREEIQNQEKQKRMRYHEEIRQKSLEQQRNGYRVKGSI